jgi:TIR domain
VISVFISYAHRDEKQKERFLVHLAALKREGLIGVWHDRMLKPGEHLDRAIEAELAAADLVICLVSPDFINSDYCTEKEMQRSFARAKDGRCNVAAVILKPCVWRNVPIDNEGGRLGDFLVTPRDGKPVTQWPGGQDAALHTAVEDIRRLITDKSASGTVVHKGEASSPPTDVIYPPAVTLEPDVSVRDAIRNVLETRKVDPVSKPIEVTTNLLAAEFHVAALDGRLPIWAKRGKSDAWEALPKEFWQHHLIAVQFDRAAGYLDVQRVNRLPHWPSYREFMTSKRAVDAQWPAPHRPSDTPAKSSKAPSLPTCRSCSRPSSSSLSTCKPREHSASRCPIRSNCSPTR